MAVRKRNGWWWVDFMYRGERLRRRSPDNSKGAAQAFEAHLRSVVAKHGSVTHAVDAIAPKPAQEMPTFAEFSARWLSEYVPAHSRPSDRRHKGASLRNHLLPEFGSFPMDSITTERIDRFINKSLQSGLRQKTVNNILTDLSGCLRVAREWGVTKAQPVVRFGRVMEHPYHYLEDHEIQALLAVSSVTPWHSMIVTALQTGLRFSELIALRWKDIDFERCLLTVDTSLVEGAEDATKNCTMRRVPIGHQLADILLPAASGRDAHVFQRPDGRPVAYRTAWQNLDFLCRAAHITHAGWHDLRHTFATRLSLAGVPLHIIQQLLGHKDIKMTLRYVHHNEAALRSAIHVLEPHGLSPTLSPDCHRGSDSTLDVALPTPQEDLRSWLNTAEKTTLRVAFSDGGR